MRVDGVPVGAIADTRPVDPAACTRPAPSSATDCATDPLGYRAAYGRDAPFALSSATKSLPCDDPCALGKSAEAVVPTIHASPAASTAIAFAMSTPLPPR